MREIIEFRAFDRTTKKEGVMVSWKELQKFPVEVVFMNLMEVEMEQRVSGLKTPVFKNDIVKFTGEEPLSTESTTTDYDWEITGKIIYHDFSWCLQEDDGHIWYLSTLMGNDDFEMEVIGNTHQ